MKLVQSVKFKMSEDSQTSINRELQAIQKHGWEVISIEPFAEGLLIFYDTLKKDENEELKHKPIY